MLDTIILGFLMWGEMSGYDIKQQMVHSTSYFYDASYGSIYPMLKKLKESGLIIMRESIGEGKFKKLYSITQKGKAVFLKWLHEPITLKHTRHDHLVRIFFYGHLEKEKAVLLIKEFIVYLEAILKDLDNLRDKIEAEAGRFELATLEFGRQYYNFTIDWCKRFIFEIEKNEV